jgi:alkyl sulfatase BDS1-like metallo-beta-lactamase superfamily hydrolase
VSQGDVGCDGSGVLWQPGATGEDQYAVAPKDATSATAQVNRDAAGLYDLADRQDFADADRGLIAPWPGPVVSSVDGT